MDKIKYMFFAPTIIGTCYNWGHAFDGDEIEYNTYKEAKKKGLRFCEHDDFIIVKKMKSRFIENCGKYKKNYIQELNETYGY